MTGVPSPPAASGLNVLDCSQGISGALAGRILADCGAAVTRIDAAEPRGSLPDPEELAWQIGKARREVDLSTSRGRDELRRLAAGADVLIESFEPGQMDKWGVGYEVLAERNPQLVYCTVTAYGPDGPMAAECGHEWLVQAYSGIAGDQTSFHDGPAPVAVPAASVEAGLLAAGGVLAALVARERGLGRGQRVDTSLLAGSLVLQMAVLSRSERLPSIQPPQHPLGATPTFRLYECADGRWIQIACLQPEFFRRLSVALELPELLHDPRFQAVPRLTTDDDRASLVDVLRRRFSERPSDAWLATLLAEGVPCAPAQDARDLWHDPLFRDEGILVLREDSDFGQVRVVGPIFVGGERDIALSSLPALAPGRPPLDGLRVLEFGGYQAAPTAGRLLADLGADVVKVEPPGGDPFRLAGNVFLGLNHGKRSIVLDLASAEGLATAVRLVRTSAVVLHNLRPAVAERHNLGHDQLAAVNPGVVSVQVSGFGADAAVADRPAYDPLGAALCGVQRAQGGPAADNPPSLVRTPVCDAGGGTAAAVAAIAGLLCRVRHGRGASVETSLIRVGAAFVAGRVLSYNGRPEPVELDAGQHGTGPLSRLYAAADGWLFLVARSTDWPRLSDALGLPADAEPTALANELRTRSLSESVTLLRAAGAGATAVRAERVESFESDPQVRAQRLAGEVVHPEHGKVTVVGPSIRLSLTPPRFGPPAPALGEHTEPLLAELR